MALLYAADGDRVDFASNSVLDLGNTGTIMMWLRLNDDTQRMTILGRDGTTAGGTAYYNIDHRADLAGDPFQCSRERATSQIIAASNAANFAAYGLNKWIFLAFVFDTAGANADQKCLMGDLSTIAAEPSSYSSQSVGSGAASTSYGTSAVRVGNSLTNTARETRGDIAWVSVWNVALTTPQIIQQQFRPRIGAGCVLYAPFYTTGTQRDYSGNAQSGSVTGATDSGVQVPVK